MVIKVKHKKIVIPILITLVVLISGVFLLPLIMYQKLVNEGSSLADNQCLKVNPLIIERKNSYRREIAALKANNEDAYLKEMDNYYNISRKFVSAQTEWLNDQKAYIDRWDFQYFIPEYMKNAAMTQFVSRAADVESTKLLIDAFEIKDLNKSLSEEQEQKAIEQIKIRNAADKKYDELWDNPGKLDWRTRFIKVPQTKCPKENLDIPNVDDFLNPATPTSTNSPLS